MKTKIILAALFCIGGLALQAQEKEKKHEIDIRLDSCLNTSDGMTTAGMHDCISMAHKAWDTELNKYYKLLMGSLSPEEKNKLQAAQRLWLKFRDGEKDFAFTTYDNLGGTMWGVVAGQRSMDLTRSRALELKAYYDNLFGH